MGIGTRSPITLLTRVVPVLNSRELQSPWLWHENRIRNPQIYKCCYSHEDNTEICEVHEPYSLRSRKTASRPIQNYQLLYVQCFHHLIIVDVIVCCEFKSVVYETDITCKLPHYCVCIY